MPLQKVLVSGQPLQPHALHFPPGSVAPTVKGSSAQMQGLMLHEGTQALQQGYMHIQLRSGHGITTLGHSIALYKCTSVLSSPGLGL